MKLRPTYCELFQYTYIIILANMALLGRTQVGLRDVGTTVTIPADPKAKLMYYLKCVASVLEISDKVPRKLTDYANYNRLTENDITALFTHCMLFSPDTLLDKCFFEDSSSSGCTNNFLELSAVQSSMLLAGGVVIAGQNRKVAKVMTFTQSWMERNYLEPMVLVLAGQMANRQAIEAANRRRRRCIVM